MPPGQDPTHRACACSVAQSCLTLCDPTDCSPPGSSVHGIPQAGILECVAMPSFRASFQPKYWTCVSCITDRFFTTEPLGSSPAPASTIQVVVNQISLWPQPLLEVINSLYIVGTLPQTTHNRIQYQRMMQTVLIHANSCQESLAGTGKRISKNTSVAQASKWPLHVPTEMWNLHHRFVPWREEP